MFFALVGSMSTRILRTRCHHVTEPRKHHCMCLQLAKHRQRAWYICAGLEHLASNGTGTCDDLAVLACNAIIKHLRPADLCMSATHRPILHLLPRRQPHLFTLFPDYKAPELLCSMLVLSMSQSPFALHDAHHQTPIQGTLQHKTQAAIAR